MSAVTVNLTDERPRVRGDEIKGFAARRCFVIIALGGKWPSHATSEAKRPSARNESMYSDRAPFYKELEAARGSRVLTYVTGDRQGLETKISAEVMDFFVHHLDKIGVINKISLLLYTRGGDTLAAWTLSNLLRSFCDTLEVIVPVKCHSAGTLICLGADSILMTKQATLGPIDPSVSGPLNPQLPGAQPTAKVPVSVEDVNAFVGYAKHCLGDDASLGSAFDRLARTIHPIVLGKAFRARSQIRMLGRRLLASHMKDEEAMERILDFLCSESGSHDYTINRREARDELGLPIEKPTEELYRLIKRIYDDFATELQLTSPYDPNVILAGQGSASYSLTRALLESSEGGSYAFITEGNLGRQQIQVQPGVLADAVSDQRRFEGWRYRNA